MVVCCWKQRGECVLAAWVVGSEICIRDKFRSWVGLFRGVVLSGARALAKRRAVEADTGPAGAHELADIAMAVTCRLLQHLPACLLYPSYAADELPCVHLGGRPR